MIYIIIHIYIILLISLEWTSSHLKEIHHKTFYFIIKDIKQVCGFEVWTIRINIYRTKSSLELKYFNLDIYLVLLLKKSFPIT